MQVRGSPKAGEFFGLLKQGFSTGLISFLSPKQQCHNKTLNEYSFDL